MQPYTGTPSGYKTCTQIVCMFTCALQRRRHKCKINKKSIILFLIANEIRGIIMTAPVWIALFHKWMH